MTERCADCPCELTCTEFARCVLEPIPEDYDKVSSVDLSTGEVLGKMLGGEVFVPYADVSRQVA